MKVKDPQVRRQAETVEVSADIDGFRLWYRLPATYRVSPAADPFVAAALLPAMAKGERLEIEPGWRLSPLLLEHLGTLQEIHHNWNPALQIVPVRAETAPAVPTNEGAFSFFSGGVDSIFTFLKRRDDIDHAVFLHGFDFSEDGDAFRTAVGRNSRFVESFGKTLIPVETNYYAFGHSHNLSRVLTQGSTLASVALLLGFRKAYVPASDHYGRLIPLGSHPLIDPLYSSESVEIVYDGAEARRIEKTVEIAKCAPALATLTVCVEDMNVNCGRCVKCLRTMIPLEIMGLRTPRFPWPLSLSAVRRTDWSREPDMLGQNIAFAAARGDTRVRRALAASRRRSQWTRLLKDVDRVLLGGNVKRIVRTLARRRPIERRLTVTPPCD